MSLANEFAYAVFRTRYFSDSRQGPTLLHGRAYYHMMELLVVSSSISPTCLKLLLEVQF